MDRQSFGSIVAVICAFSLFSCTEPLARGQDLAHDIPSGDGLQQPHYFNCGVNVAAIVLDLFKIDLTLDNIAEELNAGDSFERDCSMQDLKRTFEASGLSAKGLRFSHLDEFTAMMTAGNVAVVRLNSDSGGESHGHFAIAIGAKKGMNIVDWPLSVRLVAAANVATDPWFARTTGEFLLISRPPVDSSGPDMVLPVQTLNLGSVSRKTNEIVSQFEVRNYGGKPLQIIKVTGPCSCFLGASGDLTIAPHSCGQVTIRFDRALMPPGHIERVLAIQTNDVKHAAVALKVTMDIEGDPTPQAPPEPTLKPQVITWGRVTADEIKSQSAMLTLQLPLEQDGKPSKVSVDSSLPAASITQLDDKEYREADDSLSRTIKFAVRWNSPPEGEFCGEIHFAVDRGSRGILKFTVPISGDAR